VTGRAYAFAYTQLTLRSLTQFLRDIAPELVGKSVNPRVRMQEMEKCLKLVGWQGFAGMVVGTLDMALWARDGGSSCSVARWRATAAASV
jgi:mandelate racemase